MDDLKPHSEDRMQDSPHFNTAPEYRVRRISRRASYDKATVYAILDSSYFCHVAFQVAGKPTVIPMTYWREGDSVYFHAAKGGRFSQLFCSGDVCVSVCHFDGLSLGHSPMNHSMNYRSVSVHGRAEEITDPASKLAGMRAFFEGVFPGRWEQLRPVKPEEIDAITMFRLPLDQAAAKIRDEWPDPEAHMPDWPVWTGIIPAACTFSSPVADPRMESQPALPADLAQFRKKDDHVPAWRSTSSIPV